MVTGRIGAAIKIDIFVFLTSLFVVFIPRLRTYIISHCKTKTLDAISSS